MNKMENQKVLRYVKKIKAIIYLGGNCIKCGENDQFKLTFHHRNINDNDKEFEFSDYRGYRWSKLKDELDKCDLLCQNCHRELHYEISLNKSDKRRKDKLVYLEYSSGSCVECGYNKCPASLGFHHRNPKEKEFWIGGLNERINSVLELNDKIKKEIEKCDLLCQNCHFIKHADIEFFERNKKYIYEKAISYKEIQPKIDRNLVYEMYNDGVKQKDIANYFNSSSGTISDILKPYKLIKDIKIISKVNKELVYKLYDSGLKQVDIIKELKISRNTVYKILKERK